MKDVDFLKVVTQVFALVGAQNTKGKADQGPQVNHRIAAAVMLAEFVDLSVAVVAAGDAIVGTGGFNLLILENAVLKALLFEAGLEESTAATATEVVGSVGLHVDEILFSNHGFDHKAKIFGNRVTIAFTNYLAGVLHRKFDFQVLVPV